MVASNVRPVLALANKDLMLLVRDRGALIFTVVVPVMFALFFGTMYGGDDDSGEISLVVVDEDATDASRALTESLDASASLAVTRAERGAALDSVRRGEHAAFVVIPAGYSEQRASFLSGSPPRLELGVDPARRAEASMLVGLLTQHVADRMGEILDDVELLRPQMRLLEDELGDAEEMNPVRRLLFRQFFAEMDGFLVERSAARTAEASGAALVDDDDAASEGSGGFSMRPVEIVEAAVSVDDSGPPSPYAISFPQGMVWALIAVAMSFATSLVNERTLGTLVRLRMAPLGVQHILAGKAVACFVATVACLGLLLAVGVLLFGITPRSWPLLALSIACVAVMVVGIMMLLSTFGRTERTTSNVGWAVMMAMAMLGGGMIPVFFMPEWLSSLSHLSPITWAVLALEGPLWRGFALPELLPACGILVAIGVVCFALGVRTFKPGE